MGRDPQEYSYKYICFDIFVGSDILYDITTRTNLGYNEAIAKVKEELTKEGFGVLTEIDVKSTLKKKLDYDFTDYIILGACNPPFAKKALEGEMNIGLLLPCNVIVYVDGDETVVSAIDPKEMLKIAGNKDFLTIADEIKERLERVISNM
ncbi:Uncharacterized conserved protein, DUF302 family [Methanolobus vulcani]|jgi:uncharacterized protein (DUF302 family)|uniref:Uncharacterized conserved protein, DUF302 family n=1 Tax=Methanolobus vulcani TaxID=38026 RepID=A0A7Z7B071_9EURY|nr:hypothetical protein [Methanolobus sp.]SDG10635.1 Uncharacterized conserved protein, DUF302 family [Methanolobus vulcani]